LVFIVKVYSTCVCVRIPFSKPNLCHCNQFETCFCCVSACSSGWLFVVLTQWFYGTGLEHGSHYVLFTKVTRTAELRDLLETNESCHSLLRVNVCLASVESGALIFRKTVIIFKLLWYKITNAKGQINNVL